MASSGKSRMPFIIKFMFWARLTSLVLHPWWCETRTVIQQQFWMKESDILERVKTYSDSSLNIFRGQDPNPQDVCPRFEQPWHKFLQPCILLYMCNIYGKISWKNTSNFDIFQYHPFHPSTGTNMLPFHITVVTCGLLMPLVNCSRTSCKRCCTHLFLNK